MLFRLRLVLALVFMVIAMSMSWFLQFIQHPQFAVVVQDFAAFNAIFEQWMFPVIVLPIALGAAFCLWLALSRPPFATLWLLWLAAVLPLAVLLMSFIFFGPQHRLLTDEGYNLEHIQIFLNYHWIRATLLTASSLILFWLTVNVLPEEGSPLSRDTSRLPS